MKKFRFTSIYLVMLCLICFGILVIAIHFFRNESLILSAVFLVSFLIYRDYFNGKDLDRVTRYSNHQETDCFLDSLLEEMPVGIVKINQETSDAEWFNPYTKLVFTKEDGTFDQELVQILIETSLNSTNHHVVIKDRCYSVYLNKTGSVVYFFDSSNEYKANFSLTTIQPVIGILSVDNYDDLEDSISDSDISQVNSFIANFVGKFSKKYSMFYRRVSADRFYLFTDYTILKKLMKNRFSVIDEFRMEAKEHGLALTLSAGFSYGGDKHDQIGQIALQNLNMAEVRGGDQAVVKENNDKKKPIYFGGGTASRVKRTRTRTRAMMTAISDKIKSVDKVFIVGHQNLDLDALGSAVGMQFFAGNITENAYVVYDDSHMTKNIEKAIIQLKGERTTQLITVLDALSMLTDQSLLIMVDHSKVNLTLSPELYSRSKQVVVIDHHRRDEDFPENAIITYIESGASSASELVTELIQFQNSKKRCLSNVQASVLMTGMMLDTKNFTSRVTSRTFDVASYLRARGSDSIMIQEIIATDFDECRAVSELILQGEKVLPNVIVASGSDDTTYETVAISKAADVMLTIADIEAVFVVSKNMSNAVSISARSRSKINVQRIMEDFGGGGHFSLAAAQMRDVTVIQATKLLNDKIIGALKEE